MRKERAEVRISNIASPMQLLARISPRIARLKEFSGHWIISGFGIRLSGHFHRTTAEVSERDGDDRR